MDAVVPKNRASSRLGSMALGAALVAALLVPIVAMMLCGAAFESTHDGHAAGDAVGAASAAVGGAQRLLCGGRDAIPGALPTLFSLGSRALDVPTVTRWFARRAEPTTESGDAAATSEPERLF